MVGLAVIGLLVIVIFRWLVPDDGFRLGWAITAYILLACGAMYLWHTKKTTERISEPSEWIAMVGGSLVMGAISFGIDMMIGSMTHRDLSPIQAAMHAGSPFGFPLTVFLWGFTQVATAGFIRSFLLGTQNTTVE